MPAIDNKTQTLLQGLSDFWTRFYADIDELNALYRATEVLIAQAYLDMLSSFLNISIVETPLFNTELFKLLTVREDRVIFDVATNPAGDRHRYVLPDNVVSAHILQNKVIDPTASLERDAGYEIDETDLELRFEHDPSGYPGRVLAQVTDGNLLAFGTGGDLKRFYVTDGEPFTAAKPGHWLLVQNSGSGNNATYRIARTVDSQAVIIQPSASTTLTTPDVNSGSLIGTLIDSDFTPATGFAHRSVQVTVGGSFDDATTRPDSAEVDSWYADAPAGVGVRKGDILRILDRDAVPSIPLDFTIAVVRHSKLYFSADAPAEFDASGIKDYVILREGPDPDVEGEQQVFAQTGTAKGGTGGSLLAGGDGTPAQATEPVILETALTTLVAADRQRFVTLRGCGPITWTAALSEDGTLTRTAGMLDVFARGAVNGTVTVSGSSATPTNDGVYTIQQLNSLNEAVLVGQLFVAEPGLTVTLTGDTAASLAISEGVAILNVEAQAPGAVGNAITVEIATPAGATTTVSVAINAITVTPKTGGDTVANIVAAIALDAAASALVHASEGTAGTITAAQGAAALSGGGTVMTNNGTYRVKKFLTDHQVVLDPAPSYPEPNNGSISWAIHDGYKATLDETRVRRGTVDVAAALGDTATGGRRRPIENTDYVIDYESGVVTQTGRHAGTWGIVPAATFNYSWLVEMLVVATTGAGVIDSSDTLVFVNETAMWAPDVLVDRFNLYNNYGYLIDRFEASSERYREFIRGVFQLYILGPTLERLESALNVIAGFPVIRDDGEVLTNFDSSAADVNIITTLRLNGDTATYEFPKTLALRADVQLSANYNTLTFESFEPLTLAFQTSDHVEDPSWWTDIIIPVELMPGQSISRRRTVSALIENVIGAWDDPRIGDPGFFIGADDEGNVPSFIATHPAKRRKMANVAMERFLRWNVFFVRFDNTVISLLDADFVDDLLELILVAKPGYRYMFIEPFNDLQDTFLIQESPLDIDTGVALTSEYILVGEDTLAIQSFSWNIGEAWRANAPITGQALVVADGGSTPNSGNPIALGVTNIISKFLWVGGTTYAAVKEDVDYDIDYKNGTLTPKTTWPAGIYTIDIRNLIVTAAGSADPSLGDTFPVIGGADPFKTRTRRERLSGTISVSGSRILLNAPDATFVAALHEGSTIRVYSASPASVVGIHTVLKVLSPTQVILAQGLGTTATDVVWAFQSDEPLDGRFFVSGPNTVFESGNAIFHERQVGRYIHVKDAVNGANNKRHLITAVLSMSQAVVEAGPVAESDLHWRLEGSQQHMDLVERPLQITVT